MVAGLVYGIAENLSLVQHSKMIGVRTRLGFARTVIICIIKLCVFIYIYMCIRNRIVMHRNMSSY